ncbi:alpha/beta hydrolase fold domain-containing protein [Mycobacterium sp. 1164985.4]|uniref:alpha/beta hydrolase fold domain-containing protein n=1 Tax=Mycobacterium sp. 1164985.4 TaxID=1834069 RepID=UPI000802499D|nr:alpha/beta hydrolase fold domain-containing protein [Mycobacterium sp. 1164985.4]OBK81450.1 hypothetical protein A5650_26105 [Mycobacterium sp. 1164985.4]
MPTRQRRRAGTWLAAHSAQRLLPLVPTPRSFRFTSRHIAGPGRINVPTRHGSVGCLIYQPHPAAPLADASGGPPVTLHLHGGAFIVRNPRQEEYLAEYIAAEVGAVVVLPDYATAPQVQYPVAEQQCYDIARWLRHEGSHYGWDTSRMSLSGASAGAKLAVNVCQQSREDDELNWRAALLTFPVTDLSRFDRTSAKKRARISPTIQRLAIEAYVVDPSVRREPLASPVFDTALAEAMPPSLVMTGEFDTLGPEGDALASELARRGVATTHRRFPGIDHGFTRSQADAAREAMALIGAHLIRYLT